MNPNKPDADKAAEEILKHDFYVVQDYKFGFDIWTKEQYEKYVRDAVSVGAGSAFKIIIGFNGDENYLFPSSQSGKERAALDDDWKKHCNWFDENGGGLKAEIFKDGWDKARQALSTDVGEQDELWEHIDEIKEDESPYAALEFIKKQYTLTRK